MEKINILKNKLKNGKCSYSKCQTLVQENIENFRKTKEKEAPNKKRQVRLAEEALENLLTMKEKLKNVKLLGEALIEEIDEQGTGV